MRKILTAREGYIYTNGEIYGSVIYLADGLTPDSFYEIALDEYNKLIEVKEEDMVTK